MKVLMMLVGEEPKVVELKNELKDLQNAVGGWIEMVQPFEEPNVVLICNEEGKIDGLPVNRTIFYKNGDKFDDIMGNFFLAGMGEEDLTDLPKAMVDKYSKVFAGTEAFI